MQKGEGNGCHRDRRETVPLPDLLKDVSAKGQLLMKCGRQKHHCQAKPWEPAPTDHPHLRGERQQQVGGQDDRRCEDCSEDQVARRGLRGNDQSEVPPAAVERKDRGRGGAEGAEKRQPLVLQKAEGPGDGCAAEEDGQIDRNEQRDGGDDFGALTYALFAEGNLYCAASTMMPMFFAPLARATSRNCIVV